MNKIELTDEQLQLVSKALEMYTRISLGQFKYVTDVTTVQKKVWNMSVGERNVFEDIMLKAGELMTGIRHGNYGIFNEEVNDDARVAAHIHQAIRHEFYKRDKSPDKPTGTVNANPADIVDGLEIKITQED